MEPTAYAQGFGDETPSNTAGTCPPGKISRNVYRIPYANGMIGDQGANDFVAHCGSMDTRARTRVCTNSLSGCTSSSQCGGGGTCEYVLVAPADGRVCSVIEHFDDCGCSGQFYGNFGNAVIILHANGEMSAFLHIKQWSASLFGTQPGKLLNAGQPFAVEGDVGNTCNGSNSVTACGTDGPPRAGTCLESVPPGLNNCYRHIHWNITRHGTRDDGSYETVQPYTCGLPNGSFVYEPNTSFTAGDCAAVICGSATALSNLNYSTPNTFKVFQGRSEYTASTVTVSNSASVVLHACDRVRLTPGFHASPSSYFRAEIGPGNRTATSDIPIPPNCPCDDVGWRMCVQRSDASQPDNVLRLCNPPGPFTAGCHGCGFAGATRCCVCVGNGTCLDDGVCP